MKLLNIEHLVSGGLITNYYCSSRCRHCLYASGPSWPKDYIDSDQARANLQKIKALGCNSVHIGGGEPFLNVKQLEKVLEITEQEGISIEYIETNASWYSTAEHAREVFKVIRAHGVHTLLISISPFHNEFIPYSKTENLINECKKNGISVFPWLSQFTGDLAQFDADSVHSLKEYATYHGDNYMASIPSRYWIHYGGRAITTFRDVFPLTPIKEILSSPPCGELADTTHFHVDLFGNYVPGMCSGFTIDAEDLGQPLQMSLYPLITLLFNTGIQGLHKYATELWKFPADASYLNKCDLCLSIRSFLMKRTEKHNRELGPRSFYDNLE